MFPLTDLKAATTYYQYVRFTRRLDQWRIINHVGCMKYCQWVIYNDVIVWRHWIRTREYRAKIPPEWGAQWTNSVCGWVCRSVIIINCPDTSRQYFFVVCATEGFVFYVILWFWWKCSFHSLFHLVIQLVFDLVAGIKQRVRKCSMLLHQDRVLCNVNKSFKLSLWLEGCFWFQC